MDAILLITSIFILFVVIFLARKLNTKDEKKLELTPIIKELAELRFSLSEQLNDKFAEFFKENKEQERNLRETTEKFLTKTDENIRRNLDVMVTSMKKNFKELNTTTQEHLTQISDRVDKKLDKGFEKTNKTFANIIERMAKIDQAQKNMEKLSTDVVSLQNILNDSKSRGIFWEVQLDNILSNIFGEDNKKFYEMQYHFKESNVQVDCVVKTADGLIPIDAKFPLTNYKKMIDSNLTAEERKIASKLFKDWVKNQITDISQKYIIDGKTIDTAFMFIPAESVFAELHTHHYDIIEFAQNQRVNIVSPSTLMAMLTIVMIARKSFETQKQAKLIQTELWALSSEFGRFKDRRWKFTKDFKKVWTDISDIDITSLKISKKFDNIERLEFKEGPKSLEENVD